MPTTRPRKREVPPIGTATSQTATGGEHSDALHPSFYQQADPGDGDQRIHHADRARRDVCPAGRAISRDRAADRAGHDGLPRCLGRGGGADRRDAARAADQRRRRHDLYEQPVDRRRQAHDHRHLRHRHRPQCRPDADSKPGAGRIAAPARGRAAPRRAGAQIDTDDPARRASVFARHDTRPPLPVELRDIAHQGRAGAAARGRRRAIVRGARLCDAHLARPRQDGGVTRIRDIGRVEIGAADYGASAYMDRSDGLPLLIFAQPGANSLAVEHEVLSTMAELKKSFPPGVDSIVIYDPTIFVAKSVREVVVTIFVAVLLVVGVVILFLQTWRASLIPVIAIPISLIGTFTVLYALGISLNNLSLFGLVLAVGIVVDDAIVVVENVERNIEAGMLPKEAAHRTMDEVGGALVSIALTLCAVFVPSAFLSGITGQFFRQFAVTIAASTVISCIVSLTLSPALCALLLKQHAHRSEPGGIGSRLLAGGFSHFNRGFEWLSNGYGQLTRRLLRGVVVVLVAYGGLIAVAGFEFARTPTGFIPEQDQGYLITVVQLPPGATLARTEKVVKQAVDIILKTPGIEHVAPFAGLDATTFTIGSNSGTIFSGVVSYGDGRRVKPGERRDMLDATCLQNNVARLLHHLLGPRQRSARRQLQHGYKVSLILL